MPADFISSLFVFILAAFLGFEVIKRVSPLLHTPLMSLTNALDAIVVVAAIIIAGRHESRIVHDSRADRGGRLVQQHGRRICHHRSHAAHVQDRQGEETMTAIRSATTHRFHLYSGGHRLHLGAEMAEFAGLGDARRSDRRDCLGHSPSRPRCSIPR